MADGPVIQKAGEAALRLGVGSAEVLDMVRQFRQQNNTTPVVLMGYANPVERYDLNHGTNAFVRDASAAGVDGVLIVDYPPEECTEFAATLRAHHMDLIFLLAPTSTAERMSYVARESQGFLYYVSLTGITGAKIKDMTEVGKNVEKIRKEVAAAFEEREERIGNDVAAMREEGKGRTAKAKGKK